MTQCAEVIGERIEEAMATFPSLIQEVARFNAEQEADELLHLLTTSDDVKPPTKSRSL